MSDAAIRLLWEIKAAYNANIERLARDLRSIRHAVDRANDLNSRRNVDNRQAEIVWRRQHKQHLQNMRADCARLASELQALTGKNRMTSDDKDRLREITRKFNTFGAETE